MLQVCYMNVSLHNILCWSHPLFIIICQTSSVFLSLPLVAVMLLILQCPNSKVLHNCEEKVLWGPFIMSFCKLFPVHCLYDWFMVFFIFSYYFSFLKELVKKAGNKCWHKDNDKLFSCYVHSVACLHQLTQITLKAKFYLLYVFVEVLRKCYRCAAYIVFVFSPRLFLLYVTFSLLSLKKKLFSVIHWGSVQIFCYSTSNSKWLKNLVSLPDRRNLDNLVFIF